MTSNSVTSTLNGDDAKYLAEIDQCIAEIASIRREMKKKDSEIKRLQAATDRNLDILRANLHATKTS